MTVQDRNAVVTREKLARTGTAASVGAMIAERRLAERVQRIVDAEVPVLHLEPEVPTGVWPVVVDGLVDSPASIPISEIHRRVPVVRYADLHCVWGWSRPACRWEGIGLEDLCGHVTPSSDARFVLVTARTSRYASCFTLQEARAGLFAWRLDGAELRADRGWPIRFVPPSTKWAYKSVKWVERITFLDSFEPGPWEQRVGDPDGSVPWDVLQRFDVQTERWRRG